MDDLTGLIRQEFRDTHACVAKALDASFGPAITSVDEYLFATRQRQALIRAGCTAYADNLRSKMLMSNGALGVSAALLAYDFSAPKALLAAGIVTGYELLRKSVRDRPQY
jgi:hypothetical protein